MAADSTDSPGALAVLVAAGSSTRMATEQGAVRKPLIELAGRPLLEIACAAFDAAPSVGAIVLVVHPDDVATIEGWVETRAAFAKVRAVVPGGAERTDSVRIGASIELQAEVELVSVHDAARPLVTASDIERVHAAAASNGAALLALPVRDTLKHSDDGEHAAKTVARENLWAAQTPQVFAAARFREILAAAAQEDFRPTDDAALWERYVGPVTLVPGDPTNFKITRPADLELARAILEARGREATS